MITRRAIMLVCIAVGALWAIHPSRALGQKYTPLPGYMTDTSQFDVNGTRIEQFAVIPFVFHSGLSYNIDPISGTGITANLGQGVIQLVGSDQDSLGQGFWYQLSIRKHALQPGYGDSLYQNYPNPFNPATYVPFSISSSVHQHRAVDVTITLTSVLGVDVVTLVKGKYTYGYYAVLFHPDLISSGVYIYRMTVDDYGPRIPVHYEFSRKMAFLR